MALLLGLSVAERSRGRSLRASPTGFLDERGGLGEHQMKEAKFAEDQDRVAGARAGQPASDQDVTVLSINLGGDRLRDALDPGRTEPVDGWPAADPAIRDP